MRHSFRTGLWQSFACWATRPSLNKMKYVTLCEVPTKCTSGAVARLLSGAASAARSTAPQAEQAILLTMLYLVSHITSATTWSYPWHLSLLNGQLSCEAEIHDHKPGFVLCHLAHSPCLLSLHQMQARRHPPVD